MEIRKLDIPEEEKPFIPIVVMKGMIGFDELNRILEERFGKKMVVKGEAKVGKYVFKTEDLIFEWKDDITQFKAWGTLNQYKKKFLGGEEFVKSYRVSVDFPNKKFIVDPDGNKKEVLSAVTLLVMESIRSVAKEVKGK